MLPKGLVVGNVTEVGFGHQSSLSTRVVLESAIIVMVVTKAKFLFGLFLYGKFVLKPKVVNVVAVGKLIVRDMHVVV